MWITTSHSCFCCRSSSNTAKAWFLMCWDVYTWRLVPEASVMFLSASARPSALSTRPARRAAAGAAVWLVVWKPSGALELFAIAVLKEQERGRSDS